VTTKPFNRNSVSRAQRDRARQLFDQGLTVRQVAERLGVKTESARRWQRKESVR
jgi:uncharacterized protein YjcR